MEENKQKPFVERMLIEQSELKERLVKLNAFIESEQFMSLDRANRTLLLRQTDAMTSYLETLSARIALNLE